MSVQDCEDLINEYLETEYTIGGGDEMALVHATPRPVLGNTKVALYAQTTTGQDKYVNMRLPGIKAFLKRLAAQGVGYMDEHQDVKYKFMTVNLANSGTTTPVSNLD